MSDKPLETGASNATEALGLLEIVKAELWRGDSGAYSAEPNETICVNDLITNAGRTFLAQRIADGDTVNSPMAYMATGVGSNDPALTQTQLTSEAVRKALSTNSAQTDNIYTAVATFGGNADSVTSETLFEAGIFNHADSGEGTMFQRVTFASVTLADSDLLKITLQTNVGSNTI